jgi:hypothetical protein
MLGPAFTTLICMGAEHDARLLLLAIGVCAVAAGVGVHL